MAENRLEHQAEPEYVTPKEAEAAFALWAEGRQEDIEHGRVSISEMAVALGIDEAQARDLVVRVRESQRAKEREKSYRTARGRRTRRALAAAALAAVLSMSFFYLMRSSRGVPTAYEGATVAELAPPASVEQLPPISEFAPFASDTGLSGVEAKLDGYVLPPGSMPSGNGPAEDTFLQRLRLLAERTAPAQRSASGRIDADIFADRLRGTLPMDGVLSWSDLALTAKGREARLKVPRLLAAGNSVIDALYEQELERRLRVAANTGVRLAEGKAIR